MKIKPLIFTDGADFFNQLGKNYRTHAKGLFILAPSGAGKTHFCKNQKEPHWIDGDELWVGAGAQPKRDWWNEGIEIINEVDQKSDVITMIAKKQGFWIMGASNSWLKPDAIVVPQWETHKQYISHRQTHNYDGGATEDKLEQVRSHIQVIEKWHSEQGVPKYESIEAAVAALSA